MTTKAVTIITIICATIITAQPTNDDCANAKSITTFSHTETADTTSATFDGDCSLDSESTSGNVWYVVSGVTGVLTVDTIGCTFQTLIRVFDSCSSTCFAYNWFWDVSHNTGDPACSGIRIELLPADTLYIAVSGILTNKGQIPVNFMVTTPPISNDNACNAKVVTIDQTITDTNIGNSVQINEISPGFGSSVSTDQGCLSQDGWCIWHTTAQNSLWFQVSAYILEIESLAVYRFDSQLAVYEATDCNDFSTYSEIAANDDMSDANWNATIKPIISCDLLKHYLVQFNGGAGAEGLFGLQFKGRAKLDLLNINIISDDPNNCWNRDLNDPMLLTATIYGSEEVTNYTYQWISTTGMAVDTGFNNTLSIQPNITTIYSVIINITDSYGCSTTSTNNITITSIDALSITFEYNCTTRIINTDSDTPRIINTDSDTPHIINTNSDTSITITAIVSGGSGQFEYEWHSIPTDISSTMINNTLITSPFTTTKYNVTVRDIVCGIEAHSGVFIIHATESLSVTFKDNCTTRLINTNSDTPITITAIVSGGSGQFEYEWHSIPTDISSVIINNTLITSPFSTTKYNVTVRDIICGIEFEAHSGVFIIHVENIACNITESSSSEPIQAPNGILFCIDPSNNCTTPQCIANDTISIAKFKSKNPLSIQGPCRNACDGQILCKQTRVQESDESASSDSNENILFYSQKQLNGVEQEQEEENVIQANVDLSEFFNIILYGMLILCIVSCCMMRKHLKMVWMK